VSRVEQPPGTRGSLKWIQRAVNERPEVLDRSILPRFGAAQRLEWLSPLAADGYAEYRDGEFLDRIGAGALRAELAQFWPQRGPQWDALARSDCGDVLLIEAKAHIREFCTPGTSAGEASRQRIEAALATAAAALNVVERAIWSTTFYQLANRLAHLWFLRERGVPAWLVLVNFIGDRDVGGPASADAWETAYTVAAYALGLPERHPLSRYILHCHPDVADLVEAPEA
jgi:hypothetical protein